MPLELTVIVPTWNEAKNVGPMAAALGEALTPVAGEDWEVCFVDDNSPDGTADAVRRLMVENPRVRLIHRTAERGHASACFEGMRQSTATYVAVLDCDFQHEPACMARMLAGLRARPDLELAIAARPVNYEGLDNFPWRRRMGSMLATRFARLFLPGGYQDPLSGMFMLKRSLFLEAAPRLTPRGFKPLTDILLSTRRTIPHLEVSYAFGSRRSGESKLSLGWVWEFFRLVATKGLARMLGRMSRQSG